MNILRYAVSIESDLKFQCDQKGIMLRDCFIGRNLLWQFSASKKVFVRYWPSTEMCHIAFVRHGEFEWQSVSRCSIERMLQYVFDHAGPTRRWVDAQAVPDVGTSVEPGSASESTD